MGKFEDWQAKHRDVVREINPEGRKSPIMVAISELAPEISEIIGITLLGGVCSRPQLEMKSRALCNVAALVVMGREPVLKEWILNALNSGCAKEEIVEVIAQMAFYSGIPSAVIGFNVAKQAFDQHGC